MGTTTTKLGDYFERKTRENGEAFTTLKDDAPEWLKDAVHEAHQDDLPNDWIYDECRAACAAIDEGSLTEDDIHQHADSQVDIYTRNLFQWAADMCLSSTYSEAESEAEDLGTGGTINEQLTRIQYCAIARIATVMLQAWEAAQEAKEEEDS